MTFAPSTSGHVVSFSSRISVKTFIQLRGRRTAHEARIRTIPGFITFYFSEDQLTATSETTSLQFTDPCTGFLSVKQLLFHEALNVFDLHNLLIHHETSGPHRCSETLLFLVKNNSTNEANVPQICCRHLRKQRIVTQHEIQMENVHNSSSVF